MITTDTQEEILYDILINSPLKNAITGGILRGEMPTNVPKEFVIINSLPILVDDVQLGTSNVNIHVPDMNTTVAGFTYKVANARRLKELTEIAKPILESQTNKNYWAFYTSFIGQFRDVETQNTFVNFRIEFIFHNH